MGIAFRFATYKNKMALFTFYSRALTLPEKTAFWPPEEIILCRKISARSNNEVGVTLLINFLKSCT